LKGRSLDRSAPAAASLEALLGGVAVRALGPVGGLQLVLTRVAVEGLQHGADDRLEGGRAGDSRGCGADGASAPWNSSSRSMRSAPQFMIAAMRPATSVALASSASMDVALPAS
jgi:hypothetical protein